MAQLFWLSGQQLLDGNGTPYAGAKANFYDTGTTTPKATYSDAGLTSINANPVVADSNGRFGDIYLVAGRYKVVLTTSADVHIDTLDPVDGTAQLISTASAPATTYPFLRYHNTTDGNVYRRNAANNAWINEGAVDSLLNAAAVSDVLTGTDTTKAVSPDALAGLWQRGTDIASGSTLSLPATGGGVFNVTGNTQIDGISTAQGGRCVKLVFQQALTLGHNASSLILPNGVSIRTVAGDIAEFINDAAADASGANWRLFNYQRGSATTTLNAWPTAVSTTDYTATNEKGLIFFGSMSADVTLTLPLAAQCSGQTITVINSSTAWAVTIDPNGAELIDSVATRKTSGTARITILSDGGQWITTSGVYRYVSPSIALTTAATFGGAHGLGTTPHTVQAVLVCQTGEHGYSAGDRLYLPGYPHGAGGTNAGFTVGANSTNAFGVLNDLSFSGTTTGIGVRHKTTGAAVGAITAANWKILVECMAS